ncbi:MAG: EAL domain-containing protein [Betaproteobacteria bacterium]|nr:EAL domain-containing protein [Betaproteobacteria bacterium]
MNDRTVPAGNLEQPPAGYAGHTRFTQLEYEAVLANAWIGIAFTRDRKFFLCNPKFAELFGWLPEELIGQPGEVVYPSQESYEALGRIAVPVLSAGKQVDLDWEMRRKDGTTFLARMIAKSIDPSDARRGTVWIVDDVTSSRRHGDEVARLLREQEAIFETASVGIVFLRDRRVVRCNARFEQMYGYAPGDLKGKSTALLYLDEAEYRGLDGANAQLRKGVPYEEVSQRRRKDGRVIWIHSVGRAIDPSEPDKGSVWTNEDITEQRRAEDELQRLVAEQEALLNNVIVGISFARERKILRCNRRFEEMFGYEPGEATGAPTRQFYFTDEEYAQAGESYAEVHSGRTHSREQWLRRRDGTGFWCRLTGRALRAEDPSRGTVWLFEDISDARRREEEVRRALAEQALILDNATIGIAFLRKRTIQRCNRRMEEMLGYGPGELIGKSAKIMHLSHEKFEEVGRLAYASMASGEAYSQERQVRRKDGSLVWCKVVGRAIDAAQPLEASIWIYDDVSAEHAAREGLERVVNERTAELRDAQERAQHLADHDALTGLPNRRLLEDRLTQALALSQRNRKQTAVMFVDLDRFKAINDSLGHTVGDLVLKEVAKRLVKQLRVGDTVCRVGGDEFVIVLPEAKRSTDAANVAAKIIETLSQPVPAADRELTVTPSIGIAVFPEDGRDAGMLIRNADAAMYHAKESGRANYQFFTEQMNQTASRRLALENDLRRAVQLGELQLHYQPIVAAKDRTVAAHEALVHWQHPRTGLVPPGDLAALAEDTGLILGIGGWALREACRWCTFIGVEHGVQVAVNLSARQFNDPGLIEMVRRTLAETGLPPQLLSLEIGEAVLVQQPEVAASTLRKLKALGVALAIDDFGAGSTSLAALRGFAVDRLKIERTLVADAAGDESAASLVGGIVALAHALGLPAVAEGVETPAQRDLLAKIGCDYLQGALVGPPVDADAAAKDYV